MSDDGSYIENGEETGNVLRLHASHDTYVDTILSLTAERDPSTDFSLVSMTANDTTVVDILGSGKTRIHAGGLLVNVGGATVLDGLTVSDTGTGCGLRTAAARRCP